MNKLTWAGMVCFHVTANADTLELLRFFSSAERSRFAAACCKLCHKLGRRLQYLIIVSPCAFRTLAVTETDGAGGPRRTLPSAKCGPALRAQVGRMVFQIARKHAMRSVPLGVLECKRRVYSGEIIVL